MKSIWLAGAVVAVTTLGLSVQNTIHAQETWDYSPYKICVWMALDPSIDTSTTAHQEWVQRTLARLDSSGQAAWDLTVEPIPLHMRTRMERGLGQLTIDDFSSSDLILVLGKDDEATKTLRVLDSAVEQLEKIAITTSDRAQLEIDSQPFLENMDLVRSILEKTSEQVDSYDELIAAFREKKIAGAFIPRGRLELFGENVRAVASALPWHTERILRDYEKLFIVVGKREGEIYSAATRELDCPMRLLGPTMIGSTVAWKNFPSVTADAVVRSYAPVARIEEATGRSVSMRIRAGALAGEGNPARIVVGDVLQPVVRRDDRRGVVTMLEPIPWTYIGVTSGDAIYIDGTCYSALGNVLQGKQTRRAKRVALKVRPTGQFSDIKVVVRSNVSQAQPGCQVYERDLLTEELRLVGTTDWRGIIRIERPTSFGRLVPEAVRLAQAEARRLAAIEEMKAAEAEAVKAAEAKKAAEVSAGDSPTKNKEDAGDVRGPTERTTEAASAEIVVGGNVPGAGLPNVPSTGSLQAAVDVDPKLLAASVALRQPLTLLYVKSGDSVLARLPLVPGLNELDLADLPSDVRRLEAEAILRGFQGEILDLIAKRALLSARVTQYLADKKYPQAEAAIEEVRSLRGYKAMADVLDAIQRRLLDESKEPVPMASKSKIDRMTQTTRDMLQKYLENDLAQKLNRDLRAAQASPGLRE